MSKVRDMSDEELEPWARMIPDKSPRELIGLISHARGEYGERRAIRLAKEMFDVLDAWRSSPKEDYEQAIDMFVKRIDGTIIPLQIKVKSSKPGSAVMRRAQRFGARVVRIPITMSDVDAKDRIRIAIWKGQTFVDSSSST